MTPEQLEIKEIMWGLAKADIGCGCEEMDGYACHNPQTSRSRYAVACVCNCHINGKCPCGCGMLRVLPRLDTVMANA